MIPASGFYEWGHTGKEKTPYYVSMANGLPMDFGWVWEQWRGPDNTLVETCVVLITSANKLMEPIHDRMPVILHPQEFPLWLDREVSDPDTLKQLFKPYPSDVMQSYPVSPIVNNSRNDLPECIERQN